MAHVRWAVIALQQSMRHRSGAETSLELALIGRHLAELEYECLRLTGVGEVRNRPNAVELLDIAEQTLTSEVAPDMSKRQRYNVALIASAMGIARRELGGGISAWDGELDTLSALYGADPLETPETTLSVKPKAGS